MGLTFAGEHEESDIHILSLVIYYIIPQIYIYIYKTQITSQKKNSSSQLTHEGFLWATDRGLAHRKPSQGPERGKTAIGQMKLTREIENTPNPITIFPGI